MRIRNTLITIVLLVTVTVLLVTGSMAGGPPTQDPGTAGVITLSGTVASKISYQGRLTDAGGNPLNGNYNLVFQLWDDATAGSQLGAAIVKNNVPVSNGLFTVGLDVPQEAFNGQALWLRVQVNGEWLSPRQELLPVPYALTLKPGAFISSSGPTALNLYNEAGGYSLEGWSQNNIGLLGISRTGTAYFPPPAGMHGVHGVGDGVGVYGEGGHTGVYGNGADHGVKGESTSGDGVKGETNAADKSGVYGHSANGIGVTGRSENNYGVQGFGPWCGVYGKGTAPHIMGYGVYGESGGPSIVVGWGYDVGVWGNTKTGFGVAGTSDDKYGVYGDSHSSFGGFFTSDNDDFDLALGGDVGRISTNPDNEHSQLYLSSNADVIIKLDNDGGEDHVLRVKNSGGTDVCTINEAGNLTCTGAKLAVVETANYGRRGLYAIESPGVWFEDFGSASLVAGEARVAFEPIFAETVNLDANYHVFLTPLGEEPVLLFVTAKSATGFTVRGVTLDGQPAECAFDYRIVAKRQGYEDVRMEQVGPGAMEE